MELEDEPDVGVPEGGEGLAFEGGHGHALDAQFAGIGCEEGAEDLEQGGFSCAGGADDGRDLA